MLIPKCVCGRNIDLKRGQKTRRCPSCGVRWTRDKAGFWAEGLFTACFTPKEKFLMKKGVKHD